MGLFSGKNLKEKEAQVDGLKSDVQARALEMKNQKAATEAQQVAWIRLTSASDLRDIFHTFEQRINQVAPASTAQSDEDRLFIQKARTSLAMVKDAWFQIDRNLIDVPQAVTMFEIIDSSLPSALSMFRSRSVTYTSVKDAWSDYDTGWGETKMSPAQYIQEALTKLTKIQDRQVTGISLPSLTMIDKSLVSFPTLVSEDREVNETLARLEKIWTQATSKKNTAEDEYFLEQMVTSYLPDAWELFKTFEFAPKESQAKAKDILNEQFQLLEEHLLHILKTYMNQNLEAMKSQVGFLKAKMVQPEENPQLILPATAQSELEASA